jgi:hypothetical protein
MSVLLEVANNSAPTLAAAVPSADWWAWLSNAGTSGDAAAKKVGGAMATLFILITGWRAKGAIAGIIAGAVAAIVFLFILNNANSADIQDKMTGTVKGAPVIVGQLNQSRWLDT